jgi:hypothetical protein
MGSVDPIRTGRLSPCRLVRFSLDLAYVDCEPGQHVLVELDVAMGFSK